MKRVFTQPIIYSHVYFCSLLKIAVQSVDKIYNCRSSTYENNCALLIGIEGGALFLTTQKPARPMDNSVPPRGHTWSDLIHWLMGVFHAWDSVERAWFPKACFQSFSAPNMQFNSFRMEGTMTVFRAEMLANVNSDHQQKIRSF